MHYKTQAYVVRFLNKIQDTGLPWKDSINKISLRMIYHQVTVID